MRLSDIRKGTALDLYVVECRFHEQSHWISECNRHTELIYPLDGAYWIRNGTQALCFPGRISLIPAGTRFEIAHLPRFPDRTLVFKLKSLPQRLAKATRNLKGPSHLLLNPTEIMQFQSIGKYIAHKSFDRRATSMVTRFTRYWLERLLNAGVSSERPRRARAEHFETVLKLMARNPATVSVIDLADGANLSEFHFSRVFSQRFGVSPYQSILATRVAHALQKLHQGETLKTAALLAGFSSAQHLSMRLSALAGMAHQQLWQLEEKAFLRQLLG